MYFVQLTKTVVDTTKGTTLNDNFFIKDADDNVILNSKFRFLIINK